MYRRGVRWATCTGAIDMLRGTKCQEIHYCELLCPQVSVRKTEREGGGALLCRTQCFEKCRKG